MSAHNKRAFLSACLALSIGAPASAQITASRGLGEVNPWGVGWISTIDNALPANFWGDSRKSDLTPLFQSITPDRLSPAELTLLTRVLGSSSQAPAGDSSELIRQRVRLMKALGVEDKVLDLYRRFPQTEWSESVEQIEVDQDLASGDYNRACSRVASVTEIEDFWIQARIACLVVGGQIEDAQLAAELARSNGMQAPWLFSVVASLTAETDARAPARFDDGVSTAISIDAALIPPVNAFNTISPYRAGIIAQRKDATSMVRVLATQRAAMGGQLSRTAERNAMLPEAVTAVAEIPTERPGDMSDDEFDALLDEMAMPETALQRAVATFADPDALMADKLMQLRIALQTAQTEPRIFELQSRVLLPELRAVPIELETIEGAPMIIRAFIAADELKDARKWRNAMDADLRPPPIAVAAPTLDAETPGTVLGEGETGPVVLDPLLTEDAPAPVDEIGELIAQTEAADEAAAPPEAAPAPPPVFFSDDQKAMLDGYLALAGEETALDRAYVTAIALAKSARQSEATRMLYLMGGLDITLPAEARHALAKQRRANPRNASPIAEAAMQMEIAAKSDAIGEAMMHAIHVLRMDREGQRDAISVARVLEALMEIGQDDIAHAAALEAAGLWSARISS